MNYWDGMTAEEWAALADFERDFGIRRIVGFAYPSALYVPGGWWNFAAYRWAKPPVEWSGGWQAQVMTAPSASATRR